MYLARFAKYGLPIWFLLLRVKVTLLNLVTAIQLETAYDLIELLNCHFSVSETLQNTKMSVHINDLDKRLNKEHLSSDFLPRHFGQCSVSL